MNIFVVAAVAAADCYDNDDTVVAVDDDDVTAAAVVVDDDVVDVGVNGYDCVDMNAFVNLNVCVLNDLFVGLFEVKHMIIQSI